MNLEFMLNDFFQLKPKEIISLNSFRFLKYDASFELQYQD
jgi:hypothetical protein